jgi:2-methylcitrate dehydratase
VEITLKDGTVLTDELAVANAHPLGAKPFGRADYIRKFRILTDGIIDAAEADRFIATAENLASLKAGELHQLSVRLPEGKLAVGKPGIF